MAGLARQHETERERLEGDQHISWRGVGDREERKLLDWSGQRILDFNIKPQLSGASKPGSFSGLLQPIDNDKHDHDNLFTQPHYATQKSRMGIYVEGGW
ncbi:hypothetical protein HYFRA_00001558 [Hymenoscyphus fraxineus]|uniref:Uncharacterized protein n=1 Tax=Hymenoscyphus fraxineus TaxID=746836 RepID=A0A9N9L8H8_9HELO|nr:hypothetical protein HYFRA_00001558 [Hymenoscyphus fraxineus]